MKKPDIFATAMRALGACWIVDEDGDPGIAFRRLGFGIGYYKWADSFLIRRLGKFEWRKAEKRELNVHRRQPR